ncbi:unnamed protein product [Effrenium voratum]|nr:unnamed protein product [Effrenium voratum]
MLRQQSKMMMMMRKFRRIAASTRIGRLKRGHRKGIPQSRSRPAAQSRHVPSLAGWALKTLSRQQVYARLHESGTPLGLPDVAFEAPAMVQDAYDACIQKSPGIQMMMDAILQAAKRMAWIWRVLAFMSMCVCVCVLFVVSHSIANTAGAWTLTTGSASSRFPC